MITSGAPLRHLAVVFAIVAGSAGAEAPAAPVQTALLLGGPEASGADGPDQPSEPPNGPVDPEAATPGPPSASVPAPPPDRATVRAVLDAAAPFCRVRIRDAEGTAAFRIEGVVAQPGEADAIRAAVAERLPPGSVDLVLSVRAEPFCRLLRLEADEPAGTGPTIRVNRPAGLYHDGDAIIISVTLGNREGHLSVDLFDHSGAVIHMLPLPAVAGGPFAAGQAVTLGGVTPATAFNQRSYTAAPPFGPAMIVAIQHDQPLFLSERAEAEAAVPYMDALEALIGQRRAAGESLAVSSTFIETQER